MELVLVMKGSDIMEYSGNSLTKISGVSARALRYYDEIGLLKPLRTVASGYRIYGQNELNKLQQILFYKELGFSLEDIKKILSNPEFDRETAFKDHLESLEQKRDRLETLISNVKKSIADMKGDVKMSDNEKFEGFKRSLVDENERKYGKEIREKYGDNKVDESNAKLMGLSETQYNEAERIRLAFEDELKKAFEVGDPSCESAQKACDLHRRWLSLFNSGYNKDYHRALGDMYVADERFRANYDKFGTGCTEFLKEAIEVYCSE
jgi:DNA-binding transcriptional MerR regulator